MQLESFLAIVALALAYTFAFANGFHDTANAVATVIYTKALRAPVAIIMSGVLNFLGCLLIGTAVVEVMTQVISRDALSLPIFLAALLGALSWNIYTWYHGLPVSSSHCLIGAMFGAGMAAGGLSGLSWQTLSYVGLSLFLSPLIGFAAGALLTIATQKAVSIAAPGSENARRNQPAVMRWLQILSSAAVSLSHGSNDGQKTIGIIVLILAAQFPKAGYSFEHVPLWVIVTVAATIGIGTTIGGWRVIRTVGTKISRERLLYTHGFAAEFSTALITMFASVTGAPISTTHTLTSAVAGGTVPLHGPQKLNWKTLKLILFAWLLTLPVCSGLAFLGYSAFKLAGLQ